MGLFDSFGAAMRQGLTDYVPQQIDPLAAMGNPAPKPRGLFARLGAQDPQTGVSGWDRLMMAGAALKSLDPHDGGESLRSVSALQQANVRNQLLQAQLRARQSLGNAFNRASQTSPIRVEAPADSLLGVVSGFPDGGIARQVRQNQAQAHEAAQAMGPVPVQQRAPSVVEMLPAIMQANAAGVDTSDFVSALKAAEPSLQVSNGELYDPRDISRVGQRVGVNLSNVNGFPVDMQDPNSAGRYFGEAPAKGAVPVYGPDGARGGPVGWRMADGSLQSIEAAAQAQSAGTARGQAPYQIQQLPGAGEGGGTLYGTTASLAGPNGLLARGVSGIGRADAAYADNAGKQVADLMAGVPDLRSKAVNAAQSARQGLSLAAQLDPTQATPIKRVAAEALRAAGMSSEAIDRFAGDVKAYQSITSQLLTENAKALGANPSNRDTQILANIFPSLGSPGSAAQVFFATQAATADKQAAYADFLATYNGPRDPQAISRAWAQSPEGQRSVFQNPLFRELQVNGRPLVITSPRAASDGFYYGQVNIGAKPYRFRIIP